MTKAVGPAGISSQCPRSGQRLHSLFVLGIMPCKAIVQEDHKTELLKLYELYPFHNHPMWRAVIKGTLSREQVIRAEIQHCIRTRAGRTLRENAVHMAEKINEKLFRMLLET